MTLYRYCTALLAGLAASAASALTLGPVTKLVTLPGEVYALGTYLSQTPDYRPPAWEREPSDYQLAAYVPPRLYSLDLTGRAEPNFELGDGSRVDPGDLDPHPNSMTVVAQPYFDQVQMVSLGGLYTQLVRPLGKANFWEAAALWFLQTAPDAGDASRMPVVRVTDMHGKPWPHQGPPWRGVHRLATGCVNNEPVALVAITSSESARLLLLHPKAGIRWTATYPATEWPVGLAMAVLPAAGQVATLYYTNDRGRVLNWLSIADGHLLQSISDDGQILRAGPLGRELASWDYHSLRLYAAQTHVRLLDLEARPDRLIADAMILDNGEIVMLRGAGQPADRVQLVRIDLKGAEQVLWELAATPPALWRNAQERRLHELGKRLVWCVGADVYTAETEN